MNNGFLMAEGYWLEDNRDEPKYIGVCPICGEEIYEGDEVLEINGDLVCENTNCLLQYLGGEIVDISKVIVTYWDGLNSGDSDEEDFDTKAYLVDGEYVQFTYDDLVDFSDATHFVAEEE